MNNLYTRTKELVEGLGYKCYKTEHWDAFAKRRVDLLGFIDMIGLSYVGDPVVGIQLTTEHNALERKKKILKLDTAKFWLKSGNLVWIVGWYQDNGAWQAKMHKVELKDFE